MLEEARRSNPIMNTEFMKHTVKPKQLWIGLVEVRPLQGCDALEDAKGAFVNIVTWAANATELKQKATLVFEKLHLFVAGIENAEPVEERREREGDFEDTIEDIISRAEGNPNAIIYSTFHLYKRDDA